MTNCQKAVILCLVALVIIHLGWLAYKRNVVLLSYPQSDAIVAIRRHRTTGTSAIICAVVKDDEAYIDEWVDYHHNLGFSHFYIYDNSDDFEMKQWGTEKGNHVTVLPFSKQNDTTLALSNCTNHFGANHTWIAYMEVADFFVLKSHRHILDYLGEYGLEGALSLDVVVFGSAGRRVYSPQPVTKRFLYRQNETYSNHRAKVIVRVDGLNETRYLRADAIEQRRLAPTQNTVIHHYLRSIKEYKKNGKRIHYNIPLHPHEKHEFALVDGIIFDDSAWKAMKNLVPAYKLYDERLAGSGPRYPPVNTNNESAVICAVVKYEEAYIDEWVDYHFALGFSHFYIYDNSPEFEMQQWGLEKGNHVTVKHITKIQPLQSDAYFDCLNEFVVKNNHTWVAFIDADEMVFLKEHNNVVDLLHDFCQSGALTLNWIVYGTGEREVYQPWPFTKRFLYQMRQAHPLVKSIGRVKDIDLSRKPGPHFPFLRKGFDVHDVNGTVVISGLNDPGNTNVAVLHHYAHKSYKEYVVKRLRGIASAPSNANEEWIQAAKARIVHPAPVFSEAGWEVTKRFLPKYRYFDLIVNYSYSNYNQRLADRLSHQ